MKAGKDGKKAAVYGYCLGASKLTRKGTEDLRDFLEFCLEHAGGAKARNEDVSTFLTQDEVVVEW